MYENKQTAMEERQGSLQREKKNVDSSQAGQSGVSYCHTFGRTYTIAGICDDNTTAD